MCPIARWPVAGQHRPRPERLHWVATCLVGAMLGCVNPRGCLWLIWTGSIWMESIWSGLIRTISIRTGLIRSGSFVAMFVLVSCHASHWKIDKILIIGAGGGLSLTSARYSRRSVYADRSLPDKRTASSREVIYNSKLCCILALLYRYFLVAFSPSLPPSLPAYL